MSRGRTASSKTCTRILNEVRQSAAVSIAKNEECFSKLCCPDEQLSVKILGYTRNIFVTRKADENKCYLVFFKSYQKSCIGFLHRTAATTLAYSADIWSPACIQSIDSIQMCDGRPDSWKNNTLLTLPKPLFYRPTSLRSHCGVYNKNASDASPCPQQNVTQGTACRPLWELMTHGF